MALWARATGDAARLADADRAYEKGEIAVAGRMYVRLARSRPPTPSTRAARERLGTLAEDARKKLEEIAAGLDREAKNLSPGDLFDRASPPGGQPAGSSQMVQWEAQVRAAFDQYDRLAEDYRVVSAANREIKKHVGHERRRAEFAVVLNEPKAKALWDAARQHEAANHPCCAYWVYREGAKLAPAPSAVLAQGRLAEIGDDPELVAQAKTCRDLQKCHSLYNSAQRLLKIKPDQAKELFAKIVARAPADSEVYRAAQNHLQELPQ